MTRDKVYAALSLAAKAGKVKSGEFQSENTIKSGKAAGCFVASDASENTKHQFRAMAGNAGVPFRIYGDREGLGRAVGKDFRASVVITDQRLAELCLREADLKASERESAENQYGGG